MMLDSWLVIVGLALAVPQERRVLDVPSTHDVTARVVDARGNPVAHAHVRARVLPVDGSKRIYRSVATNAEGVSRIEGLPAGELELTQEDFNGGAGHKFEGTLVADENVTFRIPGYLGYAGRIVGDVCPEPWVTLARMQEHWPEDFVRKSRLGEDGRFAFSGLTPGSYRLSVRQGSGLFAAQTFAVEADLYETRADVEHGVPLLGAVEFDFASRGSRPGRVSAYLLGVDENFQRGFIHHRSKVTDLPYGRYRLCVHENLESRYGRRLLRDVRFDLDTADKKVEVDVSLLAVWARFHANEVPARGIQGRLRLKDPSGHVLDDQEWRLTQADDGGALDIDQVYYGQIGTGVRCRGAELELVGLAPGAWTLEAEAPGHAPVRIDFGAREGAVVDLPLERLSGRVVRAGVADRRYEVFVREYDSGTPWERILWDSGLRATHTPPVGVFAAHLPPGLYEFLLHAKELADAKQGPVEIGDEAEPLVLSFPAESGLALHGRLFLEPDVPVEASLHVWRFEDGTWQARPEKRAWSSPRRDPHFTIQGLSPGAYRLTLDPAGEHHVGEIGIGGTDARADFVLGG